ncbi:UDP-3-O-(3-hydroxymyristoyl)glucosamine N-acyltransferase [Dinghuibacter silviterrae]|uniref:UDP-3-O-[3-hydroxymyristoyl] glucosamine N-acyltransferase n=1 Tax=Dinghuibacter silviterrae TaxID=1539049 RepID=A0A4R8DPE8_9BACT|nr:UDP-3-O-(3-hydroxymyristoyl)glucosamine N-acyltransferase [Dinghuibacter silviterrae]TDW99989.1 UDP-3-O-[3-hydroxymyristoyl] glucosamine N-acyltransferase [Dinghuibacter silviterrae]
MKFPSPVSVQWIADFIGASIIGNEQGFATGINELHKVEKGDLAFVDHPKYYAVCIHSAASFIIINQVAEVPPGKALLVVPEPFEAYLSLVRHFRPFESSDRPISASAVIGKGTVIMPNVFVGNHVVIGENCLIHPGVSIYDHCQIGDNVVVHAGTAIGGDAFYYNRKTARDVWFKKMDSCGRVVIESDVEIGCGCTIDRGVSHDTVIGRGTKMDNMVHVGHDVVIGKNCLIAAQVGIAGVVTIGDGVTLWGQVGISKTLTIGDHAVVLAQSGVPGDLEGGKVYFGSPVEDAGVAKRRLVWLKRLPELWDKVKRLEER